MLEYGFLNDEINNLFAFINHVFEIKDINLRREFYQEAKDMALSNRNYEFNDYESVVAEIAIKKDREKIVINMLKMGLDIKVISQATGLTISEVEELKKNLK